MCETEREWGGGRNRGNKKERGRRMEEESVREKEEKEGAQEGWREECGMVIHHKSNSCIQHTKALTTCGCACIVLLLLLFFVLLKLGF